MANIDVEDIGDELISLLRSELADNLAAVEARKATQLNPDAVQEYHFGEVSETPLMPSVIVAADTTQTDLDDTYRKHTYKFVVELNYEAEDAEKCRRIVSRYGSAIDDTLRANSGPHSGFWITIENIAQMFSDTWTSKEGGLYQTVRLSFDVIVLTN